MRPELRDQARGHWTKVLLALGISERFLSGRHGPCPLCGGKDRFRFDDKDGLGTWICNQCRAGDGISLVMELRGWSFNEAAKEIRSVLGDVPPKIVRPRSPDVSSAQVLNRLWQSAGPITAGDAVDRYLRKLGVAPETYPRDLRKCPYCHYAKGISYPAMLALVRDSTGKPITVHRTFLERDQKAPVASPRKIMAGKLPGSVSVQLDLAGEELGIAEGIETALACRNLFGLPVWSALSANLLAKWVPPDGVKRVHVFADNDRSFVGQEAAYRLARRLGNAHLEVEVHVPRQAGLDWADIARARE